MTDSGFQIVALATSSLLTWGTIEVDRSLGVRDNSGQFVSQSNGTAEPITGVIDQNSRLRPARIYHNAYQFSGQAGDEISIDLESQEFDAFLILVDANGNWIAEDNDSGNGTNARISVQLPETGIYTVRATINRGREGGRYTLTSSHPLTSISTPPETIEFVNHPEPTLEVDFKPFLNVGCSMNQRNYWYRGVCDRDSPLYTLGCDTIQSSYFLEGLEPSYPIAQCWVFPGFSSNDATEERTIERDDYLFSQGGFNTSYMKYVIFRDGRFQAIAREHEFRKIFAPIETADEALSYVLALTKFFADYRLEPEPNLVYYTPRIEETHVERIADGYLVRLFDRRIFGCGPFYTYAVDVSVTFEGEIEEVSREAIWRDSSRDTTCVD